MKQTPKPQLPEITHKNAPNRPERSERSELPSNAWNHFFPFTPINHPRARNLASRAVQAARAEIQPQPIETKAFPRTQTRKLSGAKPRLRPVRPAFSVDLSKGVRGDRAARQICTPPDHVKTSSLSPPPRPDDAEKATGWPPALRGAASKSRRNMSWNLMPRYPLTRRLAVVKILPVAGSR